MKTIQLYTILLLIILVGAGAQAQKNNIEKPTIVFVHGVWADGTSFSNQITALQGKGYKVVSVQNPVTSLAEDVAATKRAIELITGKVILVGHSWGGFVISQFSNEPKVAGLVYLAGFAPEEGETIVSLNKNASETELSKYLVPSNGYVFLSEQGVKTVFAGDLNTKQQELIYATQIPASHTIFADKSEEPAWKNKPSWYVVAKNDKTINPDLERFMAVRMKAKTVELESSHVVMNSKPNEVLKVIEEAVNFKY
ncbi:alpha/beta hydrolase [Flavobacterium sp. MC2016-06]|uniref:alpha/beta hydrolase n=1 Tax=Flavobacterium sp. MC2016-06 TaxID=2676308 RepID=UPI0012BAC899|nr:alpha/beta hydrolase [Flavobacterium sp. MC2016-06]MBU3862296.1 alpha/beta hydrolase [Flavobacterium sp. MC2016-06]